MTPAVRAQRSARRRKALWARRRRRQGRSILLHAGGLAGLARGRSEPLPVHVKVIVEGEEEIGSGHLAEFLREHTRERLDCRRASCSPIRPESRLPVSRRSDHEPARDRADRGRPRFAPSTIRCTAACGAVPWFPTPPPRSRVHAGAPHWTTQGRCGGARPRRDDVPEPSDDAERAATEGACRLTTSSSFRRRRRLARECASAWLEESDRSAFTSSLWFRPSPSRSRRWRPSPFADGGEPAGRRRRAARKSACAWPPARIADRVRDLLRHRGS